MKTEDLEGFYCTGCIPCILGCTRLDAVDEDTLTNNFCVCVCGVPVTNTLRQTRIEKRDSFMGEEEVNKIHFANASFFTQGLCCGIKLCKFIPDQNNPQK